MIIYALRPKRHDGRNRYKCDESKLIVVKLNDGRDLCRYKILAKVLLGLDVKLNDHFRFDKSSPSHCHNINKSRVAIFIDISMY